MELIDRLKQELKKTDETIDIPIAPEKKYGMATAALFPRVWQSSQIAEETKKESYKHLNQETTRTQTERIKDLLSRCEHGLSDRDISKYTGIRINAVTARRRAAVLRGEIIAKDTYKDPETNVQVVRWALKQKEE